MDIRRKIAKGAFWLFLERGAQQFASLIVFAVIARLIGPEEYGLVGLCIVILTFQNALFISVTDGIISLKITDDTRLSSFFWIVVGGGFALSILTYLIAGPFSLIFHHEKLTPLLQCFAVLPFLFSLASIQTALITAQMDFRIFAIRSLIASVIGGGTGIIAAYNGWGGYAIAAQQIVSQIVIVIVVWTCCAWRPKLILKKSGLREVFHLGMSQIGIRLIGFVEDGAPRFLLGYFIGPVAVGQFAFVARICGALQDGLIYPVLNVLFPAFVQVQNDPQKREELFGQIVLFVGTIMIPVATGIVMTAPEFVPLFFGDKWVSSIILLQFFSLTAIIFPFGQINFNILRAQKMTALYLRILTIATLCNVIFYAVLVHFGLLPLLIGKITLSFCMNTILAIIVAGRLNLPFFKNYASLWPAFVSSGVMAAGLYSMSSYISWTNNTLTFLATEVFMGIVLFSFSFTVLRFELVATGMKHLHKKITRQA